MSIVKDFSNSKLINIINSELQTFGSKIRVKEILKIDGHSYIIAKTTRNAQLVIQPVCMYPRFNMGIRAIHRIKNKNQRFTYLPNGQGGKNLDTILSNGEQGKIYTTEAA